ncbi:MAG: peptidase, partial [Rhodoferax sp.]|nr:peptidase [Rhodoferax sp.]
MIVSRGLAVLGSLTLASVVLVGCGARLNRAPVESRGTSAIPVTQPSVTTAAEVKPLPGTENAGKPGYYT